MLEPVEESTNKFGYASREHANIFAGMQVCKKELHKFYKIFSLIDLGFLDFFFRGFIQNVLQIFITQVASVFMSWVPVGSPVLLEEQVDICKRVLNIYRYMVMNSPMEQKTWLESLTCFHRE